MRIEQIVVNASPLIVLLRSGLADLLPQLFHEIVIPETVWYEIVAGGHFDQAASGLQTVPRGPSQRRLCCRHGSRYGIWVQGNRQC